MTGIGEPGADLPERRGRLRVGDGDARDLAPLPRERPDLRDGRADVAGVGVRHALDGDGRAPAHRHAADADAAGFSSYLHSGGLLYASWGFTVDAIY